MWSHTYLLQYCSDEHNYSYLFIYVYMLQVWLYKKYDSMIEEISEDADDTWNTKYTTYIIYQNTVW